MILRRLYFMGQVWKSLFMFFTKSLNIFSIVNISARILTDIWCNSYDWDVTVTTTLHLSAPSIVWLLDKEVRGLPARSPEMCVVRRGEADCQLMATDVDTITKIQNWGHRLHTSASKSLCYVCYNFRVYLLLLLLIIRFYLDLSYLKTWF